MRLFKLPALFKDIKPGSQFFLFVCLWALFFIVFGVLSALLINDVFDLPKADEGLSSAAINQYKLIQLITSVGIFILPPLILAGLFAEQTGKLLKVDRLPRLNTFILSFLILFFSLPLLNLVIEWNASLVLPDSLQALEVFIQQMEKDAEGLTKMFLHAENGWGLLVNVFIIAVIPAVGEELLFRGVFQNLLHRWSQNYHLAIWITALGFSLLHFQFYGFVPRMLLGALFGYLLVWSGSLWVPIFAHFVNNGSAVIISYLSKGNTLQDKIDGLGTNEDTWYYVIPSTVLLVVMLWFFYKENNVNRSEEIVTNKG